MQSTDKTPASIDPVLNRVRALRHRTARDRTGHFFLEGVRAFVQACDAGAAFDTVLISPILLKNDLADMLARKLKSRGVRICKLTPEQFRSISSAERASGIGAIVKQRWSMLENADPSRGLAWLVIEHLRSPGNLGTILRTAEATGVGGIMLLSRAIDPFDAATVRASMGALFHLPLIRTTHAALSAWAIAKEVTVLGLSPDAPLVWTDLPPLERVALFIGTEREGLSADARSLCRLTTRLPMTGLADSLNVATATAVMLYELVRRQTISQRLT